MRISNLARAFRNQHVRTLAVPTQGTYNHFLDYFERDVGNAMVSDFKPANFMGWLDTNPQWARSSRKTAYQIIRCMFGWAYRNDLIDRHPLANKVKIPGCKVRGWESIPTKEEFDAIRTASPSWMQDFLDVLYFTGRRPSDVCNVQAGDIDLLNGIWRLDQHKTASKVGSLEIVLCPETISIFARLAGQHPTGKLLRRADGKAITRDTYVCCWKKLRKKLGLRPTIVPYGLRHKLATDLINKNVPLTEVASLMGHKGIQTCVTTYVHLCTDRAKLRSALARR